MKYIKQFLIIISITFLGEILNYILPLPIPSGIYGLIIMLLALQFKIIKLVQIKETANFLLKMMPLMFIPAAVGIVDIWADIKPFIFPIVVIVLVSTFLVSVATGITSEILLKRKVK